MSLRYVGKVKWFDAKKGFGFIKREDTGTDYFVHWSDIKGGSEYKVLRQDERVSFAIKSNSKGERAVDVSLLPPQELIANINALEEENGARK